jgi:hypothetical protein
MEEDRRRHPRYRVHVSARLTLDGLTLDADVHEICRDAVLVEADRPLEAGTQVLMQVALPGGPVEVLARVVRRTVEDGRQQMALLFVDVTPAAATQIDMFLDGFSQERRA